MKPLAVFMARSPPAGSTGILWSAHSLWILRDFVLLLASPRAEHRRMERVDHTRTVAAALVQLQAVVLIAPAVRQGRTGLVDAYPVSFNVSAMQTTAMRRISPATRLATAPFTEISYRIWRAASCARRPKTRSRCCVSPAISFCPIWIFRRGRFSPHNAPPRRCRNQRTLPEKRRARSSACGGLSPAAIARAIELQPGRCRTPTRTLAPSGSRAALPSHRP